LAHSFPVTPTWPRRTLLIPSVISIALRVTLLASGRLYDADRSTLGLRLGRRGTRGSGAIWDGLWSQWGRRSP
jgi:hypothetical protein